MTVNEIQPADLSSGSGRGPESIRCIRCGGMDRLIRGDGAVVCRVCLIAWTAYASTVAGGPVVSETGRAALAHLGHQVPRLDCSWCRSVSPGWAAGRFGVRPRRWF